MRVLNVIQVQHHVVAHLERQVQTHDFFAGRGIGGFRWIQRRHTVADRGAVDFHEHQSESAGDVFHQRRFAVTGRRDQQQQSHSVGAFVFADRSHLFGEVVPDQRQVNFVEQSVADETAENARFEFIQTHRFASGLDALGFGLVKRAESRHHIFAVVTQSRDVFVIVQRHLATFDSGMAANQPRQAFRDGDVDDFVGGASRRGCFFGIHRGLENQPSQFVSVPMR